MIYLEADHRLEHHSTNTNILGANERLTAQRLNIILGTNEKMLARFDGCCYLP
jgi:hypothetical protein